MHSSRFFRVKPIGRLFYEVRKIGKPYNFLPIPTIKYYLLNEKLAIVSIFGGTGWNTLPEVTPTLTHSSMLTARYVACSSGSSTCKY